MKRNILIILILSLSLQVFSQTKMIINKYNGTSDSLYLSDIKNITFKTSVLSIPTNGLVAWYPFNGNTNDSSVNANNGTNNGAISTTDRFGNSGCAYNFNGTDSYIRVPILNPIGSINIDSFSVSLWFKGGVSDEKLFETANESVYLYYYENKLQFFTGGVATIISGINNNTWNHVVGIYDGTTSKLFVNDTLVASNPVSGQIAFQQPLCIGKDHDGSYVQFFNGVIDDIRIYKRSLNNSEIQALFHEGGWK